MYKKQKPTVYGTLLYVILSLVLSAFVILYFPQETKAQINGMQLNPPVSSAGSGSLSQPNFSQYENSTYGFAISYPSNWNASALNVTTGRIVGFFSPDNSEVRVVVLNSGSPSATLDEYVTALTNFLVSSGQIIASSPISLSGLPGHLIIAKERGDAGSPPFEIASAATVKNGVAYSVEYIADASLYTSDLQPVARMINSFQLTGNSVSPPFGAGGASPLSSQAQTGGIQFPLAQSTQEGSNLVQKDSPKAPVFHSGK